MIIMIIFNMSTSYFHKISFHYFEDYLMSKLTLGQGSCFGNKVVWTGGLAKVKVDFHQVQKEMNIHSLWYGFVIDQ